jgi:hypothetical protein
MDEALSSYPNYYFEKLVKDLSTTYLEDALREHFKQMQQRNKPLPDFIDPSKL